jgi:hypothetical protein
MEAAKGMPYRQAWQDLLSLSLLSTPFAWINDIAFVRNNTSQSNHKLSSVELGR